MDPDKIKGTVSFLRCRVQLFLVLVLLLLAVPAQAGDLTVSSAGSTQGFIQSAVRHAAATALPDGTPPTTIPGTPGGCYGPFYLYLSCSDPNGSGCDSTLYCLGTGCTPDTPYLSPLHITASSDLRFFSRDKSGNAEAVQTVSYRIDQTPPVTTANPPGGSYPAAPFVTLSCSDGSGAGCSGTYYCLGDNCTPTTWYSAPVPINDSQQLRYFSSDNAGNNEAVLTQSYVNPARPKTFAVPGTQPTIQSAIDAAYNGDTVTVAPGTYQENINFRGKGITVASSAGPEATIIDGGHAGAVVTFSSGEGLASVLSGFTVHNGSGTDGGGIFIDHASPTVTNNSISDNTADWGGGIFINVGSPLIQNNAVSANQASIGAGIAVDFGSSPRILGNVISGNAGSTGGGGIVLWAAGTATLQGNTIRNNSSSNYGGGIWSVNGSHATILQNLVAGNQAGTGGGASAASQGDSFINNTFVDNDSTAGAGVYLPSAGFVNNIVLGKPGKTALYRDPVYLGNFSHNIVYAPSGNAYDPAGAADQNGSNGNLSADPLLSNPQLGYCGLRAGSPAIDAGDGTLPSLPSTDLAGMPRVLDGNGDGKAALDMGAYEFDPAGPVALLQGIPAGFLAANALKLAVGGSGVVSYRYALDGGAFGAADTPAATPITLGSLANGQHYLAVVGKNAAGQEQQLASATAASWVVDTESTDLAFSYGGAAPWFEQTSVSRDGIAYQSGSLASNQSSWMETSVSGPGAIRFWWKLSSQQFNNPLDFSVDGTSLASISGNTEWQNGVYVIPAGSHTLRWTHSIGAFVSAGIDAAWLDQVSFQQGSNLDVTPPTTVVTPAAGLYASSQSVALSCNAGSGSPCAGTFYCLGSGCSPGTPYSGPIAIGAETDLRFYSLDGAGNGESVTTASYRFDNSPPTTYTTLNAGSYSGPHDLTLYCGDNAFGCAATYYCLGAGCSPATAYSSPLTISSSTDLRYYSVDSGGNRETVQTLSFTITPDLTPPVSSTSPSGGVYGPTWVSLGCSDAGGCAATYYCLGAGCTPATPYSSSLYLTAATELNFYSVDRSGNREAVKSASYSIDATPPSTSASAPGGIYSGSRSVTLTCSDAAGSGCATTLYCLGKGCYPGTRYTGPIAVSASDYLRYFSRDAVNNWEAVKTERYTILTADPATIKVPTDRATIQAALDAASDGDTITVAPGTYQETIDFKGKAVTLQSSGGPDLTIIDGNRQASVVSFTASEWNTSVLRGFTLRNGQPAPGVNGLQNGGGIYLSGAAPTLAGNKIVGNFACNGGGIYALGSPIIRDNLISGNFQATSCGDASGGGIYLQGDSAQIVGNTIVNNAMSYGTGGGISVSGTGANLIQGNTISHNGGAAVSGGGISAVDSSGSLIVQNLVTGNSASIGGGLSLNRGITLTNNTVADNAAPNGSGVYVSGYSLGAVANGLFSNNIITGQAGQAALYSDADSSTNPTLKNNLLYSPTNELFGGSYSGQNGLDGNISADPKLSGAAFGYYGLRAGSPAIDAGDNNAPGLPLADLDGAPRLVDATGPGGARVDIGAYEFDPGELRAELSGAPASATKETGAALTVGGAGIVSYRYAVDGGPFGAELPVATPIALSGLAGGSHAVAVLGKSATRSQLVSSATVSEWTIDNAPPVTTATPPGGSYAAPQSVTLSCSDGSGSGCAATFYCLGGGCTPDTPYTGPVAVSATAGLRYYSLDAFGYQEAVKTASYLFVATLSGTVTDSGTGAGINGVSVQAYDAATGVPRGYGYSDLSGAYLIPGLPGGSYKLRFYADSYVEQWYSGMSDRASATSVTLSAPGVSGALNVAMVKGGSITGTVTDKDTGAGIPSVYVNAYSQATGSPAGYGFSDNNGFYLISGLPAGSYKLNFDLQNSASYLSQWYSNKADLASATAVTVTSASTTSGISVALARGGSLTGKVTDSVTGAGIPGVYVNLVDAGSGSSLNGTSTDNSGVYSFSGLAGNFKLVFSGAGYLTRWYGGKADQAAASVVSVTAPNLSAGVDVVLAKGASISGKVTDSVGGAGLSGARVFIENVTSRNVTLAFADNSGAYSITGLSTGSYRLRFSSDGYVDQWYGGAADLAGAVAVLATAPNQTSGINLALVRGAVIAGRITDRVTGAAAQGVTVSAVDAVTGSWGRSGYTDSTGAYSITGLASGSYKLQAVSSSQPGYITQWYGNKEQQSTADSVTVTAPGSLAGVDITMEKGSVISGSVSDRATGAPLANVVVAVTSAASGEQVGSGYTDGSGGYTVSALPSGNYLVSCSAAGYLTGWFDGKADATSATTVALSAPNALAGINLALDGAGSISGTVTDRSSGVGIANCYLSLTDRSTGNWVGNANTDSSGAYTLTGLASGSYSLRIEAPSGTGYLGAWYGDSLCADSISVSAPHATSGVDARLDLGGSISGRATDAGTGLGVPGLTITLSSASSQSAPGSVSTTTITADTTGAYTVGGLASGAYFLTFSAADYPATTTTATAVSAPDAVTGQDIVLVRGGGISGRVVDSGSGAGVSNVLVEAVGTLSGASTGSSTSDANGNYLITGLPSGSYALFYDGRYVGLSYGAGWFVEAGNSDSSTGVRVSAAKALSVIYGVSAPDAAASQVPTVIAPASQPVPVDPVVTIPVTLPVPVLNPLPVFLPLPGVSAPLPTNPLLSVSFPLPVIIPLPSAVVYPVAPAYPALSAHPVPEAATVSVAAPAVTSGVNFAINQLGAISGRVSDGISGAPLNWVTVAAYDSITGAAVGSTLNESDGSYTLGGLPSGSYRVRFSDSRYLNGGYLSRWYGSSDASTVTAEVAVLAPAVSSGIDAGLAKGGGISGTVTVNSCPGPQMVNVRAFDAGSGVLARPGSAPISATLSASEGSPPEVTGSSSSPALPVISGSGIRTRQMRPAPNCWR